MTEFKKVRLGEKVIEVPEPVALESARLFKATSDAIWAQRSPSRANWATVESQLPLDEAKGAIEEVVGKVNRRLVLSGTKKVMDLGGGWGERVKINPDSLRTPYAVSVSTDVWDTKMRDVEMGGQTYVGEVVGSKDYYRRLSTRMSFDTGEHQTHVIYSADRIQPEQNRRAILTLTVFNTKLATTGYEGNHLLHRSMTEEGEIRFVKLIQNLGGITLLLPEPVV